MIRTTVLMATALCLLAIPYSQAATLIESKDSRGEHTKMWLEGFAMRVDIANQPTYMLFDVEKKKMYAVDPAKQEAMDMSHLFNDDKKKTPEKSAYKVLFDKQGKGPVIAGYDTVHYQTKVNGMKCTDEYLSEKALKDIGSFDVFKALSTMAQSAQEGMPVRGQDPCESIEVKAMDFYQKYGFPLKMVEKEGEVNSEVIRISLNVAKPKKDFQVPDGYQVVDLGKMINEQMKYMPQGDSPQAMPQMRGMDNQQMDPAEVRRMLEQMMKDMEQK